MRIPTHICIHIYIYIYICIHMHMCAYTHTYVYIYIYIYTSVCLCASAHREERWNWSKVATMVSGYYPAVLSQIAITNTITITIITSIARYASVDTIPCRHSKSGHYPHVKLKRWHYRKVETIPFCERGHYGKVETIVKRER